MKQKLMQKNIGNDFHMYNMGIKIRSFLSAFMPNKGKAPEVGFCCIGITDSCFRQICKDFGADVVYSEMASSSALKFNSKKKTHHRNQHKLN